MINSELLLMIGFVKYCIEDPIPSKAIKEKLETAFLLSSLTEIVRFMQVIISLFLLWRIRQFGS